MTALTALGTPFPHRLRAHHVEGAKLYASRLDQVTDMIPRGLVAPGGLVMEVGVAYGDFSIQLIRALKPRQFVAIDIFKMHEIELDQAKGKPFAETLAGKTHRQFYEDRMRQEFPDVDLIVREGDSHEEMARFGPGSFNLVYIDALHSPEPVARDTAEAVRLCNPNGIIIFNDYVMLNIRNRKPYGVVQAANALLVEQNWRVTGFALSPQMYCDLAVTPPR